jgi:NADPH-dependent curcumin reductase CurA
MSNRCVVMQHRPSGVPTLGDLAVRDCEEANFISGEVLCQSRWFSLDPYLRSVMGGRHMSGKLEENDVIPGSVLAQVIQSEAAGFAAGDWVLTQGFRERFCIAPEKLQKLDALEPGLSESLFLGLLGMPGLTAWAGITQLAKVQASDVVLISAALGPVGSTAGQIAKALGARVIGIAGGAAKCKAVIEHFSFDACLDYKAPDFLARLKTAAPNGVNVYFDNVGGRVLEAALQNLALQARVVLCGLMDQYNQAERPPGPNLGPVIGARAHLMGLVVYDYFPRMTEFQAYARTLIAQRKLRALEDISLGIEQTPAAFVKLMRGENFGKVLVKI